MDPLLTVLFICEVDPLQCSSNWDPLTASRLTKWDPLFKFFYNSSYGSLMKIPPIGMGLTLHRAIHL